MIFVVASILIQIGCILHIHNTGRDRIWILVVLFFSLLGCAAYFALAVMPEMGAAKGRAVRAQEERDPVVQLNRAEAALATVDTPANQIALGDAHAALRSFNDAAQHYQLALDQLGGSDHQTAMKLATAFLEAGKSADSIKILDTIETPRATGEVDRLLLLRARALEHAGEKQLACEIYADIATRMTGGEAQCRYAALLIAEGDKGTARIVLAESINRLERASLVQDAGQADMLAWAKQQLAEL
jgi:hypothetical protein